MKIIKINFGPSACVGNHTCHALNIQARTMPKTSGGAVTHLSSSLSFRSKVLMSVTETVREKKEEFVVSFIYIHISLNLSHSRLKCIAWFFKKLW